MRDPILVACVAVTAAAAAAVALLRMRRPKGKLPSLAPLQPLKTCGSPHPEWKPGVKQPLPFASGVVGMKAIDPQKIASNYPLVISAYVPRPVAFACSVSKAGVRNLAPFSYSGAVGHDPPAIMLSVCRKGSGGPTKDTYDNIMETGEFTLSMMSEWFIEAANYTCLPAPPEVDELSLAGLTPEPSLVVKPPRVAEAAVQMECKLIHTYDLKNAKGEVNTTVMIGEVVMWHVHEELLDSTGNNPKVNFEKYRPISRLGGNWYGSTDRIFELPRPDRPADGRQKPSN